MTTERAIELQEYAWTLQSAGRLAEAFDAAREALQLIEAAEGVSSPDTANLLNDLAEIERDRQNFNAALALAERAHGIESSWAEPVSTEPVPADDAAAIRLKTSSLLGDLRRIRGDYAGAEAELQHALAVALRQFGEESDQSAQAENDLAILYKYWGRFDEALELYGKSLRKINSVHGPDSLAAGAVLHNIGGVLHSRGDFAAAEGPGGKAWEISRHQLGADDPRALLDATAYAAILDGLERYAESESVYRRALSVFESKLGLEHTEVAATLHNLAAAVAAQGRPEEAEEKYRRALRVKETLFGGDSPDVALTRNNLGRLLTDLGRRSEAVPLLEAAVATLEQCLVAAHPHLVAARRNLENARRRPDGP